jgi:hypothetical protein
MSKETEKQDLLEVAGRKFDLRNPEEKEQLSKFVSELSTGKGRADQRNGQLLKEISALKKLSANSPIDRNAIEQEVSTLAEQGETTKALQAMFSYFDKADVPRQKQQQENLIWSTYVESRPEFFNVLDEDVYKTYTFSNYREELLASDNPIQLLDSIFEPKLKKASKSQSDSHYVSVGGKNSSSAPAREPEKKSEDTNQLTLAQVMEELQTRKY